MWPRPHLSTHPSWRSGDHSRPCRHRRRALHGHRALPRRPPGRRRRRRGRRVDARVVPGGRRRSSAPSAPPRPSRSSSPPTTSTSSTSARPTPPRAAGPCVLAAGKHVVCEKPLAVNPAEAEELLRLAEDAGVTATVPFVYRFYPTVREARARVADGSTGPVRLLHGSYLQDWLAEDTDDNWRVDAAAGGAVAGVRRHRRALVRPGRVRLGPPDHPGRGPDGDRGAHPRRPPGRDRGRRRRALRDRPRARRAT